MVLVSCSYFVLFLVEPDKKWCCPLISIESRTVSMPDFNRIVAKYQRELIDTEIQRLLGSTDATFNSKTSPMNSVIEDGSLQSESCVFIYQVCLLSRF